MSKISDLPSGGSLQATDYLIAVRSGSSVKVQPDSINFSQVDLADSAVLQFGDSQDLTIVHNTFNSVINQAGTGNLLLQKAGTTKASITANGLEFPDNSKAIFGAGSDLQIYHDGSASFISDQGTGHLKILAGDFRLNNAADNAQLISAVTGAEVNLYYNNAPKLATTATGIDVTGTATMDGLTVDGGTIYHKVVSTFPSQYVTNLQIGQQGNINNDAVIDELLFNHTGTSVASNTLFKINSKNVLNIQSGGDISFYDDTGTTPKFFWDASAEALGIGTSTPATILNTKGATLTTTTDKREILLEAYDDGVTNSLGALTGVTFRNSPTTYTAGSFNRTSGIYGINLDSAGYGRSMGLALYTSSIDGTATEKMRIDASGNVGIGTSSPSSFYSGARQLVVGSGSGEQGITVYGGNTDTSYLLFADGTSGAELYAGQVNYSHANNSLNFGTNGITTPRMTIDASGNLLVQATALVAPNFKIQGPNAAAAGMNVGFISMGNSNGGYPYIGYNCAPTTTAVTYNRYVNDYASWIDFFQGGVRTFTSAGGTGNTTGSAGPYVSQGGTSWTSSSDRRLKDDVQAISYGLDAVKALEPVSYVRNDRDIESRELGFIAQDVEGVVDEVVNITDDGYYGLDYQRLIPVLTKAIQEQQATIEALTARIAALES